MSNAIAELTKPTTKDTPAWTALHKKGRATIGEEAVFTPRKAAEELRLPHRLILQGIWHWIDGRKKELAELQKRSELTAELRHELNELLRIRRGEDNARQIKAGSRRKLQSARTTILPNIRVTVLARRDGSRPYIAAFESSLGDFRKAVAKALEDSRNINHELKKTRKELWQEVNTEESPVNENVVSNDIAHWIELGELVPETHLVEVVAKAKTDADPEANETFLRLVTYYDQKIFRNLWDVKYSVANGIGLLKAYFQKARKTKLPLAEVRKHLRKKGFVGWRFNTVCRQGGLDRNSDKRGGYSCKLTGKPILPRQTRQKKRGVIQEIVKGWFADGSVWERDVHRLANEAGISRAMLSYHKRRLGIIRADAGAGRFYWYLGEDKPPTTPLRTARGDHSAKICTDVLAEGPLRTFDFERAARRRGATRRGIDDARKADYFRTVKVGQVGSHDHNWSCLPNQKPPTVEDIHAGRVRSLNSDDFGPLVETNTPIAIASEQAGAKKADTPSQKKIKRNREARTSELLLALFESDRQNLDKSESELARILKVHRGTISRALEHPKFNRRFQELRREHRLSPSLQNQI